MSDWSRLLACGDAGGEVEGVHLRMFLKEYLKFVSETFTFPGI